MGQLMNRQLWRLATMALALGFWTAAWLVLSTGLAAAQVNTASSSEIVLVAELVTLILLGRLLGEAMQRIGQPAVMGELLAGILLGPSVLGHIWPDLQHWLFPAAKEQKAMLDGISNFGILLLLLLTGMETDLKLVRKFGRAALSVALSGVAVPFVCGVALGEMIPQSLLPNADKRLLTALFLGTALSISSIKIVAAVVRDMNFTRRNLGQVIISSSIMEDTIGWIIISITFGLAAQKTIDIAGVAKSLIGTAAFLIASFTVGRRLVFQAIRFVNDNFESEFAVITAILAIMGVMALITSLIGVNTVLGAFVAGVLVGQSPILTKHIDQQLRGLIVAFFMPVFFGVAGLGTNLGILANPALLGLTLGLIGVASFGKFAGAFIGAKIGGLTLREALALGFAMNARGSTEIIVASIGLSMGALTQNLFTMIVAMAVTTTMVMPPMLRWGLSKVPMSRSEKQRLEREEIEARGFVPNIERLLLAVDDSPNGRFASRLAGLIAGPRGMPITVVPLGKDEAPTAAKKKPPQPAADEHPAKEAAVSAAKNGKKTQSDRKPRLDVTVRKSEGSDHDAVAEEAEKGYDLLLIGLDRMRGRSGRFNPDIERIAADFEGPLAIVEAKGAHHEQPEQSDLDIVVPVNGSQIAQRGAEVAIAIARVVRAPLRAIYVSETAGRNRSGRSGMRARWHEQAILKDIVELADMADLDIKTAVRAGRPAADAILSEVGRNADKLIVMGVARPSGELFLGEIAAAVLEKSPASILLISS
jgi:Kef-type K+ transport system membrane component KefB/nucleotide-binding universal stress UspA family protein